MLRLIFLLLLSANLLFLAWQAWMVSDQDPDLILVSPVGERQLRLAGADPETASAHDDWRPEGCLRMGPFGQRDEAVARADDLGLSSPHIRDAQVAEVVAWWVMIPPERVSDTETMRARLEAAGAGDYFIITTGDEAGGVSLGLFTAAERAERRRERVQAMGFDPVIRERTETVTRYWLILPLGLSTPDLIPADQRLEPAMCPEAPESLVTREQEPLE